MNYIYQLPAAVCLIIFSLRKLLQRPFDYLIRLLITKKVDEFSCPESVELIICLLKELIFFSDGKRRESSDEIHKKTVALTNQYIVDEMLHLLIQSNLISSYLNLFNLKIKFLNFSKASLVSREKLNRGVDIGTHMLLEAFQYPIINKNVT